MGSWGQLRSGSLHLTLFWRRADYPDGYTGFKRDGELERIIAPIARMRIEETPPFHLARLEMDGVLLGYLHRDTDNFHFGL